MAANVVHIIKTLLNKRKRKKKRKVWWWWWWWVPLPAQRTKMILIPPWKSHRPLVVFFRRTLRSYPILLYVQSMFIIYNRTISDSHSHSQLISWTSGSTLTLYRFLISFEKLLSIYYFAQSWFLKENIYRVPMQNMCGWRPT